MSPAEGSSEKQLDLVLNWKNDTQEYFGKTTYDVFIGTDKNNLEKIASDLTETTLNPGLLEPGHTYFWRVDSSNDIGTTEGSVWSFTLVDGGTLFYTDFDKMPQSFYDSEWGGAIAGSQADIFKAGSTGEVEFDNMTVGTAGGRIVSFGGLKASSYAPNTNDDKGASDRAIGFIGKNGKVSTSYIVVNEIEGPWMITVYTGNSDKAKLSFDISEGDSTTPLATFNLAAAKKTFKFTYVHDKEGVSDIRIGNVKSDTDKKGINFFDIKVEKYVKEGGSGVDGITSDSLGAISVETFGETLTVNNLENGETVRLYDLSGSLIGSEKSNGGSVSFAPGKGVYIINVEGKKPAKVIL